MRGVWQRVLLLGGSLLFLGLMLEVALRVFGIEFPSFYAWDPQVGHVLRPGASGWNHREGHAHVRINRDGFRDRDRALPKAAGTTRIAILGDSMVEALQVAADSTLGAVLERALSRCPSREGPVEVLSFGVAGYGTAQELLTLRHKVWRYEPDIVLLTFLPGNDLRNNSRVLEGDPNRPYFVLRDERLELDAGFATAPSFRSRFPRLAAAYDGLLNHSRMFQVLQEARARLRIQAGERRRTDRDQPAGRGPDGDPAGRLGLAERGLDTAIYGPPASREWAEAWAVTESLLVAFHEEVTAHGARFRLVVIGTSLQVDPSDERRARAIASAKSIDLDYADRRLQAFAASRGIPAVALSGPFQSYARRTGHQLHGFGETLGTGHWNEQGHRLAGLILADSLCRGSWMERP